MNIKAILCSIFLTSNAFYCVNTSVVQTVNGAFTHSMSPYFNLVPPTLRTLRFIDKNLRDKFNRGLKMIKQNGTYDKTLKEYKSKYYSKC